MILGAQVLAGAVLAGESGAATAIQHTPSFQELELVQGEAGETTVDIEEAF